MAKLKGICEISDQIKSILPTPLREELPSPGTVVLIGGEPGEVVVRLRGERITVSIYAIVWEGPHRPVVRPKDIGSLKWKRMPDSRLMAILASLVETAREARRSAYRKCDRCDDTKPPEWMHDETTCQGCAERYLGVVH